MFGANLRELSRRYPSVSELSRRLNINRTQFNRYLSGESFPRPDVLDKICEFFNVDARILLEPVNNLATAPDLLSSEPLADFVGFGTRGISEDIFPSGIYRFSRRSFVNEDKYAVGLVHVFREDDNTYVRGYEAKEAMHQQGLQTDGPSREFRGFVAQQEDGIALVISRRKSMTCSFNYLSRVASMNNNFWVGYAARTVRESTTGQRAVRMVYEHLGGNIASAIAAARETGLCSEETLIPFHRRLLQPGDPFR